MADLVPFFDRVVIRDGVHERARRRLDASTEGSALEWASILAGERWSDKPRSVSYVIAAFVRAWGDGIATDNRRTALLRPLIPRMVNTRNARAVERRRAWMIADWEIREAAPLVLRLAKLDEAAELLARLPELRSREEMRDAWSMDASVGCERALASWTEMRLAVHERAKRVVFASCTPAPWETVWEGAFEALRSLAGEAPRQAALEATGRALREIEPTAIALPIYDATRTMVRDASWCVALRAVERDAAGWCLIADSWTRHGHGAPRTAAAVTFGPVVRRAFEATVLHVQESAGGLVRRLCAEVE